MTVPWAWFGITPNNILNFLSFIFFTATLKPSILTINNRFLLKSLFLLVKYISIYLSNKNFVLCLFAHTIHLSYTAISCLQLSAALPPQAIMLVSLMNPVTCAGQAFQIWYVALVSAAGWRLLFPSLIYCNRVRMSWLHLRSLDLLAQLVTVGRRVYLLGALKIQIWCYGGQGCPLQWWFGWVQGSTTAGYYKTLIVTEGVLD